MAVLIGMLAGSLIGGYLVYSILLWAIFKRITPDPLKSRIFAAAATYPVSAMLYGFGAADENGFRLAGFVSYLPACAIIMALAASAGRGERRKAAEQSGYVL